MLQRLEAAAAENDRQRAEAHLTFVFVGAGYAGVEALAELSDLVRDALRYYPQFQRPRPRWVLVDAAPKILPEIPTRLGEYAAEAAHQARRRDPHVDDARVGRRRERSRSRADDAIATHTLVWTAGVMPNPILRELGLPVDERGAVRVDSLLRVEGHEGLWALGDCARVPNELTPGPDPPTSQHALRQARRLAKNLSGDPKPYRFRMLGQVATLGRYKGIALVFGVPLRGFIGWFVTQDVPPLPTAALFEEASRRDRLDGVASLPAGHRRAGQARAPEAARR